MQLKINKKTVLKKWVRILLFVFTTFLIIFGVVLFTGSINNSEENRELLYSYNTNQKLDYNVHLIANDLFDDEVIARGQMYSASFIDKIKAEFNYQFNGSKLVPLEINYNILGTIIGEYRQSTTDSSSRLWIKDYELVPSKNIMINERNTYDINEVLDIDFNFYNAVAADFRKSVGIPITSSLRIQFNVSTKAILDDENVNDQKQIVMTIPLLQEAFKITESVEPPENKNIYQLVDDFEMYNYTYLILGTLLILIGTTILTLTFKKIFNIKEKSDYEIQLNKLLKNYGNIIVEINNQVDTENLDIIYVKDFNEMLDLKEELQLPIMFYETKEGYEGEFTLIHGNILYKYILD